MYPKITLLLALLLSWGATALLAQSHQADIQAHQAELNQEFADSARSPLSPEDLAGFKGLPFFPIDAHYRVTAHVERISGGKPFQMPVFHGVAQTYEPYAIATFTLDGQPYQLHLYQSHRLRKIEAYADYLFLPFTDQTNGKQTYGGGRYLDLRIPEGDSLDIDFNRAYNPFCAYSDQYSCPIPPAENRLPCAIRAGVQVEKKK
jgi:hypothetical protein